jgi:HNH endonuclease
MSGVYIPVALRKLVTERARNRCEYCQTPALYTAMRMELDHIIPRSLEGPTKETNLCLACSYCNDSKNDRVIAFDPESGAIVSLYNPRTQTWSEHFKWSENGELVIGFTAIGRATVSALDMNRSNLVIGRNFWVGVGWHPPKN